MPARSAGILLYRPAPPARKAVPGLTPPALEVLLVHPGGPLWARRDAGAWSIPKGEYEPEEAALAAARREFAEELGIAPPGGSPADLGEIRQRSGKLVRAWALAGDLDPGAVASNTFELEWPPRSGRMRAFPEVDRAAWFTLTVARAKINPAQVALLDRLEELAAANTAS